MPFNGVGVASVAGANAVTNTPINSTEYNAMRADLNGMLTNCVTRDGQSPLTQNLPGGGFRLTNIGAPVVNNDAARRDTVSWEKLATLSVTGTPTWVEAELPAGFDNYQIEVVRGRPTALAQLLAQVSFDGGATWFSSSSYIQAIQSMNTSASFSGGGFGGAAFAFSSFTSATGYTDAFLRVTPARTAAVTTFLADSVTVIPGASDFNPSRAMSGCYITGTFSIPNRIRIGWGGTTWNGTAGFDTRVHLAGWRT